MSNIANSDAGTKIAFFKGKQIRKIIHENEWWFVIADVVSALTDSIQPDGYIKDMRRRDPELSKGWGQIATPPLKSKNCLCFEMSEQIGHLSLRN